MNDRKLKLVLKGTRNYVQGSTILDEATRLLREAGYPQLAGVKFLIYEMTNSNLEMTVEALRDKAPAADSVAILSFEADGEVTQARIRQVEGSPHVRVPYDESAIVSRCQIDPAARSIRLTQHDFGFSPIEVFVSMNKALHLAVLEKSEATNWVFCRLDCPAWPVRVSDLSGVTITLKQALGTRLTRAGVELGQQKLGEIYFSAKAAS
ncbi:hypothetical protein [Achromobacter aegrifaciens]|uniref:hypothetical protein n=1 Tax=Achromobacter aegrifaciens TaxID=1287736 RepID=UPI0014674537|nr:hypothetical protein [Achromobacter aegrifaciens]CAB3664940.1 hypothetical protein LMG26852_03333 [Achromobacter aegrifaciens]